MNSHIPLPFDQEPIYVDWRRPDLGGVRIAAWTDQSGNPYIGIFPLNGDGKPRGIPCWFERKRFLSHIVIGFDKNEAPVKVFLDAELTHRGIQASLQLPWEPAHPFFFHRRLFSRWGSEAPAMRIIADPSNDETANYSLTEAG